MLAALAERLRLVGQAGKLHQEERHLLSMRFQSCCIWGVHVLVQKSKSGSESHVISQQRGSLRSAWQTEASSHPLAGETSRSCRGTHYL